MPKVLTVVKFKAKLLRPAEKADWTFLLLPIEASKKLPTRAMCSVEGTFSCLGTPGYRGFEVA